MLNIDYQVAVIIQLLLLRSTPSGRSLWSVTLTDFVQVFLIIIRHDYRSSLCHELRGGWDNVASNIPRGGRLSLFGAGYDLLELSPL